MAIDRIEQALDKFFQEQTQQFRQAAGQKMEADGYRLRVGEEVDLNLFNIEVNRLVEKHNNLAELQVATHEFLDRLRNGLTKLGLAQPPIEILGVNGEGVSSEDESVSQSYIKWIEMDSQELAQYQGWIEEAARSEGGMGQLQIEEGEKSKAVNEKLRYAGISLHRKVTFMPKIPHAFRVSEPVEALTFENISLFEQNLGEWRNFDVNDPEDLHTQIKDLEMEVRYSNALKRSGVTTVIQAVSLSADKLIELPAIGVNTLSSLIESLIVQGITPKQPTTYGD